MTNEELEGIKESLKQARAHLQCALATDSKSQTAIAEVEISHVLQVINNVQQRAIQFGRGPDCYNCDCKVKCERYAQR